MPTPDELAQQLRDLADQVDRLDDAAPAEPGEQPPAQAVPAKPTGLAVVIGPNDLVLTWDPADGVEWDVLDLANSGQKVKETVHVPRSVRSAWKQGKPARRYAIRARNAAGESELSDVVDVPPAAGETPAPSTPPSEVRYPYDLLGGDWYLTLPTGKPGSPETVALPALKTYSDDHIKLNAAGDGVVFTAPVSGVTTKNSSYPRSELRQTKPGGGLAAWSNAGAGQVLVVREAFTKLPVAKPECVGFQIHDSKDDVIEGHLSGRRLTVKWADGKKELVLDEDYQLGTPYEARVVAANKKITVAYNGQVKGAIALTGSDWYWKVGAYVQSNVSKGEKSSAAGEVIVYSAKVAMGA